MKTIKNVAMAVVLSGWLFLPALSQAQVASLQRTAKLATPSSTAVPYKEYVHGDPTVQEQLLLEITNRCRANPYQDINQIFDNMDTYTENAVSKYNVDIEAMIKDFLVYLAKPPLAFNAKLIACARDHSDMMAAKDYQGHGDEPDPENGPALSTLAERLIAAGYSYRYGGENVFAYAHSLSHAHASFIVDWGQPVDNPIGHRTNILDLGTYTGFREIGIGIRSENSSSTSVGPLIVTQEFGLDNEQVVFITGVVYQDSNKNGTYGSGEALAGVQIMPDHGEYYAASSTSGGFAIPVAVNSGNYTLTAVRSDLSTMQATVQVNSQNIKVDFSYNNDTQKGIISGIMIDALSGLPIASGTVVLSPGNLSTNTASDGSFSFADLGTGNYTLIAAKDGYTITPNNTPIALAPGQMFTIELKAESIDNPVPTGCGAMGMVLMGMMAMAFKGLSVMSRRDD